MSVSEALRLPKRSAAFWMAIAFCLMMVAVLFGAVNNRTLVSTVVQQNNDNRTELRCRAVSNVEQDLATSHLLDVLADVVVRAAGATEEQKTQLRQELSDARIELVTAEAHRAASVDLCATDKGRQATPVPTSP